MLICGLKLTHDGAVALIRDSELIGCIEMEKLGNNRRFTGIEDTAQIAELVATLRIDCNDIDRYAVDGWGGYDPDALALQPRLEIGTTSNLLSARDGSKQLTLSVAQYEERKLSDDLLAPRSFTGLQVKGKPVDYFGFLHVADHLMSAYCTSPFAQRRESSYVLVWDGGMYPRLYFFEAKTGRVENLGPLFLLVGNIYTIFSQHFAIFKVAGTFAKDDLSIAGKVMAYIAKGVALEELMPHFDLAYRQHSDHPMGFANVFARRIREMLPPEKYRDEDILASFHAYLEGLLVEKLEKKLARYQRPTRNLCLVGGCALNIKWNSAIRGSKMFEEVHVPPFPNDSGSAIGAACCAMRHETGMVDLAWDVYRGPNVVKSAPAPGWHGRPCDVAALARVLHESCEPVVFVNGRAELGPRALGNRSILAAATSPSMKDLLNRIKRRESYRPVSPLCLEHRAREIFEPGTPDPWMLFEHRVRSEWIERIPAIMHLDGTARLQTVNQKQNPVVASLLEEYSKLSDVPVLCNTSANYEGCGFFPDVRSATAWGGTKRVWCDNVLYESDELSGRPGTIG